MKPLGLAKTDLSLWVKLPHFPVIFLNQLKFQFSEKAPRHHTPSSGPPLSGDVRQPYTSGSYQRCWTRSPRRGPHGVGVLVTTERNVGARAIIEQWCRRWKFWARWGECLRHVGFRSNMTCTSRSGRNHLHLAPLLPLPRSRQYMPHFKEDGPTVYVV